MPYFLAFLASLLFAFYRLAMDFLIRATRG